MNDRKVLFSMFYVPAVSKMHYLVVLVLQV
jgi:hypothetical protein